MKIKTKFFGEIECNEKEILLFPFGLYGFEEYNQFVLLHDEDDGNGIFMWLQSIDNEDLCFIVVNPGKIIPGYSPKIPRNILNKIGAADKKDIEYAVIAVICEDVKKSTVNLLSPIIFNIAKKIAVQTVLDNSEPENSGYRTKHNLFRYSAKAENSGEDILC